MREREGQSLYPVPKFENHYVAKNKSKGLYTWGMNDTNMQNIPTRICCLKITDTGSDANLHSHGPISDFVTWVYHQTSSAETGRKNSASLWHSKRAPGIVLVQQH